MSSDDEFYESLMLGAAKGRRLSDPCLSAAQRAVLLEQGSALDTFHRRISEDHPNDSILRRCRDNEDPPCFDIFVYTKVPGHRCQQFINGLPWKHWEHTVKETPREATSDSDLNVSYHAQNFWRLDINSSGASQTDGQISSMLPTLDKERSTVKRKERSNKMSGNFRSSLICSKTSLSLKHRVITGFFCFRGRTRLLLEKMNLEACDIPLGGLVGTACGSNLTYLSLSGNPLESIPSSLVRSLPALRSLNLSSCNLLNKSLPSEWNLPKLTRLDLSHNCLTDFPNEVRCS